MDCDSSHVVYVSPGEPGALGRALKLATPFTSFVVEAGHYEEPEPLEIVAEGVTLRAKEDANVHILCAFAPSAGGSLLRISSKGVKVSGLMFETPSPPPPSSSDPATSAEDQKQARLSFSCVVVEGESNAALSSCIVKGGGGLGVFIWGNSTPSMVDCEVSDCVCGIVVRNEAAPNITKSKIHTCRDACVKFAGDSKGKFDGNLLYDSFEAGQLRCALTCSAVRCLALKSHVTPRSLHSRYRGVREEHSRDLKQCAERYERVWLPPHRGHRRHVLAQQGQLLLISLLCVAYFRHHRCHCRMRALRCPALKPRTITGGGKPRQRCPGGGGQVDMPMPL